MVTDRLYYSDAYLRRFSANVAQKDVSGRRVYLDRTAFYPASGGQPQDRGRLNELEVLEVVDEGECIAHLLAEPLLAGTVTGAIDWPRRYDHMQQHTGQHLLSAVFAALYDCPTLSFHMGEDVSTIELGTAGLSDERIAAVEEHANHVACEARAVNIHFENAETVEGLRKLSERSGLLRIIEITGLDRSACGGTHVHRTSEVLPLQIRRQEKVRGHVRLEFVCGLRATRRARRDYQILAGLAQLHTSPIDLLPAQSQLRRSKLIETDKTLKQFEAELGTREGKELYAQTFPAQNGLRLVHKTVTAIDDRCRALALSFAKGSKAVFVLEFRDPAGVLVACSSDSGLHAGSTLQAVLAATGGRGGGSATLAQGSLPNAESLRGLLTRLGFDT